MRRLPITFLAATLAFAALTAHAQGDLTGVTMRVLDDVSDIDAVVLELDANRGEAEDSAESGRRASGDEEAPDGDAAESPDASAEEDRLDDRRGGDELHDPDIDERSEGRLEDRDVERPAAAQPTP